MPQPALRIEGLTFEYGVSRLFEDFRFSCDAPIAILCGRSGCGKTTLLKLLAGVLFPKKTKAFDVPLHVRMVLQEDALFPWLTARENISIVRRHRASPLERELVEPIADLLDRPVFELSFGQRRLVELCRALSDPPPLVCLDEPFNFLDPTARSRVARLIQSVAAAGHQIILSTHHLEDVSLFRAPVFRFPEEFPIHALTREG